MPSVNGICRDKSNNSVAVREPQGLADGKTAQAMTLHCPTVAKSSFVTRSRLYFETTVILSLNSENNGRILKMIKTLVMFGNHDFEIIYETEVIIIIIPVRTGRHFPQTNCRYRTSINNAYDVLQMTKSSDCASN